MGNHYNAFISYKHASEDNRVADAVHKGLEHFHIPGKLRKKTGMKKIDRIFRDKAELPITNDLSDNIADALANSDYLIVLCSTNTKESAWVPREIDAFLQNHTKRDVFTVLVNGEPRDVIPEILQHEERVITDENGEEKTVSIPMEPLSCDYRIPSKKAKKEELPRLAAGLIGCAYDELMNRRRQYRMKRLTAIFSIAFAVVLGFAGYMLYSRNQIHANYLESLKNQSRYLANESVNLLEKEQRITALQLALETLPKDEEDDRPVTAEAVKALTDATLAYESNNITNIHAAWNYTMPNPVSDFCLSSDKKKLGILDDGSVVGLWNTETHERILYIDDTEKAVSGIGFVDDSGFILWTDDLITCYDTNCGDKRWEYALEKGSFKNKKSLMIGETSIFLGEEIGFNLEFNSETGAMKNEMSDAAERYLEFDSKTGALKNELELPKKSGTKELGIVECKLSPDGKRIAFTALIGWQDYTYGVMDVATKTTKIAPGVSETVKDITWIGDDMFAMASTMIDNTESYLYEGSEVFSTDHVKLRCVGASDLTEKWNADFTCNGVNVNSGFTRLGEDAVAYHSGNVITVYSIANGQMKYTNNVNDSVIDVSDQDGDGTPVYITKNGGYAHPALSADSDAVYYSRYFADELCQVAIGGGVYVRRRNGNEVIYYGIHVYDDAWTELGKGAALTDTTSATYYLDEDCLVTVSGTTQGPALDIFKLDGSDDHAQVKLDGENTLKYNLLGTHNNRVYLGYNNSGSYQLVSVDMSGNDLKKEDLFKMQFSFEDSCSMKGGKLIYTTKNDKFEIVLTVYDVDTGTKKETVMPEDVGYVKHEPVYYEAESAAYLRGDTDYILDVEGGRTNKVAAPDGWAGATCFSDGSLDGRYAVSDGKTILIADKTGNVANTIRCPGVAPDAMTFIADELIVLYGDGSLYRYDKESGEFRKKTDVTLDRNLSGEVAFDYDAENGLLYIGRDMFMYVVDMEGDTQIAHIDACFGHHMGRDIFITAAQETKDQTKIGYYKRYTVEELIEKARTILRDAELSPEMKSRYGIE